MPITLSMEDGATLDIADGAVAALRDGYPHVALGQIDAQHDDALGGRSPLNHASSPLCVHDQRVDGLRDGLRVVVVAVDGEA